MWTKLDDRFFSNPKVMLLDDSAFRLYVLGLNWSVAHLTDGNIPERRIVTSVLPAATEEARSHAVGQLESSGLWIANGDGWDIHDFAEFQPTKAADDARRAREREKKRRQRDTKGDTGGDSSGESPGDPRPDPTRPDPSKSPPTPPVDNSVIDEALAVFAGAQNLKVSKRWVARNRKPMLEAAELIGDPALLSGFVEWAVGRGCRLPNGLPFFAGEFTGTRPPPGVKACPPDVGCNGSTWVAGADGSVPCPECRETWP